MTAMGEMSLATLLRTLKLDLHPDIFVFLTIPPSTPQPPSTLYAQMSFRESEGLTIITTRESARKHGYTEQLYTFPCRMITCNVHSSLEAVGFMVKLTTVLAERGIGCNPVSAYFHDHLFVSDDKAEKAIEALTELAEEAKQATGGKG